MLRLALFRYADLATVPCWVSFLCPLASRPWRRKDLEENPHEFIIPYLNTNGFVDFTPGDPEDPRNWSKTRSWYISVAAMLICLTGTITSSVTSGCLDSISSEFGVSSVVGGLTTTLFLLGYCTGPFVFAPLSEFYGRRWITYYTFSAFLAFNVLCAFAPNIGSLLIGRFFSGMFVSAPLCTTPGILSDLWNPLVRDNALALFATAVWAGPSLGPVISAYLDARMGWRWAFHFVLMLGGAAFFIMLTIPETHAPTILRQKAMRHRQAKIGGFEHVKAENEEKGISLLQIYKIALTRPWALLFDFISLMCALYMAIVFMLQFMLFSIYPFVFQQIRQWSATQTQLPLLGAVVGAFLAAGIILVDTQRRARLFSRQGYLKPEDHLVIAMVGGIGFPVTMFWFAWSGQYESVHWVVPTLAGLFLSASLMLVFVAFVNYMVQTYGQYAASIVAVNTFARSMGSASAPLFTDFMFEALGVGGGGSLLGGCAALLSIIPFLFSKYGGILRARSKYTESNAVKMKESSAGEEYPTGYRVGDRGTSYQIDEQMARYQTNDQPVGTNSEGEGTDPVPLSRMGEDRKENPSPQLLLEAAESDKDEQGDCTR